MFSNLLFLFALYHQSSSTQTSSKPAPNFEPLWAYSGSWKITKDNQSPSAKPDDLVNACAQVGRYLTCQQTVNGSLSALLVFIPASTANHFYTQSIMPDGRAGGRGELAVQGDRWIFTSSWNQGGTTTHYKTINTFSGKTQIRFEQQESANNKDWKTTGSGHEVRTSPGRNVVVR